MRLSVGSTGPVVSAVQQAVGTAVDGVYGATTALAVRTWQRAHGLAGSSVVTLPTWRALLKANAPVAQPPAGRTKGKAGAKAKASPLARYSHVVLRHGSSGPAVTALQRQLHVHADGLFGPHTEAAVNRFKRNHHMPADGVVRHPVWCALGAC
jgi:peptidoglycan hydrolase-like protein with peptidoglycan-binding domain